MFRRTTVTDVVQGIILGGVLAYSVSDRSGLVPNADGSVDICIQHGAPAGHASNWLPAPSDKFSLWLRVYVPGAAILDGAYQVPPVVEVK